MENKIPKSEDLIQPWWKNKTQLYTVIIVGVAIWWFFLKPNSADPTDKERYYLSGMKSAPYYFKKDGTVETWDQGKEYWDKSCSADGKWHVEGEVVVVEGVSNSNCPDMRGRNGRFLLDDEALIRQ